jgi:NADH-quinone oxidoreductase subunit L
MTWPLMALAVGAIVAGFVGVPAALGGGNAIEHFLEPSFVVESADQAAGAGALSPEAQSAEEHAGAAVHLSRGGELALMLFSVLVAAGGIWMANRFYVQQPELPGQMAARWPAVHRTLLNKYYVDEFYGATAIRGTFQSARALWKFDSGVVDGAVDGSGVFTRVSAWFSHMFDKFVVDGLVNFVGWATGESSFATRKAQTGLVQNYALLILFGVFAFLAIYLISGWSWSDLMLSLE